MPRCRRAVGRLAALLLLACVSQAGGQTDASEGAVAPSAGASGGVGSLTATEADLLSLVAGGSGVPAAAGPEVAQPAITVLGSPAAVTAAPAALTTPGVGAAAVGAPGGFVWRGFAAAANMPNAPPSWMLQCVSQPLFACGPAPPRHPLTPPPVPPRPPVLLCPAAQEMAAPPARAAAAAATDAQRAQPATWGQLRGRTPCAPDPQLHLCEHRGLGRPDGLAHDNGGAAAVRGRPGGGGLLPARVPHRVRRRQLLRLRPPGRRRRARRAQPGEHHLVQRVSGQLPVPG